MRQLVKLMIIYILLSPTLVLSQPEYQNIKELAEQGHDEAQFLLGSAYDFALLGVQQNHVEAERWYRSSAEQGHDEAQFSLGNMYVSGRGVQQDHIEAAKWFRLASEQGNVEAQSKLGIMYILGTGIPQNAIMAYIWLSLAATQGSETSRVNRDLVSIQLTPEQLDIASKCFESEYKNCIQLHEQGSDY